MQNSPVRHIYTGKQRKKALLLTAIFVGILLLTTVAAFAQSDQNASQPAPEQSRGSKIGAIVGVGLLFLLLVILTVLTQSKSENPDHERCIGCTCGRDKKEKCEHEHGKHKD